MKSCLKVLGRAGGEIRGRGWVVATVALAAVVLLALSVAVLSYGRTWEWHVPEAVVPPEPEIGTPSMLRVGFVSDWEYGSRTQMKHKLTSQAPAELEKAVAYFNDVFRPDLVVGGGDYVESSSVKPEKVRAQLEYVNGIFSGLEAPRLYALGNHDMRQLSKEEIRGILGMEDNHAIRDIGEWRIVVLDSNFNDEDGSDRDTDSYTRGFVSREELEWLRGALRTDRPVMVFVHHSPLDIMNGDRDGTIRNIGNAAEVRRVLEEAGSVALVVSGHSPTTLYEERNGIHYVIVDTLVNEPALGAFAAIEAGYVSSRGAAEFRVRQFGLRSVEYVFDWWREDVSPDILPDAESDLLFMRADVLEEGEECDDPDYVGGEGEC